MMRATVKHVRVEDCPHVYTAPLPCVGKTGQYQGIIVHVVGSRPLHGVLFDEVLSCGALRCCFDKRELSIKKGGEQ